MCCPPVSLVAEGGFPAQPREGLMHQREATITLTMQCIRQHCILERTGGWLIISAVVVSCAPDRIHVCSHALHIISILRRSGAVYVQHLSPLAIIESGGKRH